MKLTLKTKNFLWGVFAVVLLVVGFVWFILDPAPDFEDTNGASDFSLQTITDENIINQDIGASGLSYTEQNYGAGITSSEYHSKNFNGVSEIYLTNYVLPSDVRVYIGHMNVTSGNFKLVAVNNDQIIHEFDLDAFNEGFWFEDLTGSFAIRVAGESAAFEFSIDVD